MPAAYSVERWRTPKGNHRTMRLEDSRGNGWFFEPAVTDDIRFWTDRREFGLGMYRLFRAAYYSEVGTRWRVLLDGHVIAHLDPVSGVFASRFSWLERRSIARTIRHMRSANGDDHWHNLLAGHQVDIIPWTKL